MKILRKSRSRAAALACSAVFGLCVAGLGYSGPSAVTTVPPGSTLTIHANATDADGDRLTYRWAVTDGHVREVNGPSTVWRLPAGNGLHFLYVQVSDRKGGYTERRLTVATEGPAAIPLPTLTPADPSAPASPAPTGTPLRDWVVAQVPDVRVRLLDAGKNVVATATSDLGGQVWFPSLAPGFYGIECAYGVSAAFSACNRPNVNGGVSADGYGVVAGLATDMLYTGASDGGVSGVASGQTAIVAGHVTMADGRLCGVRSALFDVEASGTAALYDLADNLVGGPARINDRGNYQIPAHVPANGTYVLQVRCEGSAVATRNVAITGVGSNNVGASDQIVDVTVANHAPVVTSINAFLGATPVVLPTPAAAPLPSDAVPRADQFLALRGQDSRVEACRYYVSIGVATACDSRGRIIGGLTFDQWKKQRHLAPYNGSANEYRATFVNKVDLNLTRDHHAVNNGPNDIATVVCNYRGPADSTQAAVDSAIADARAGRFLIACVAMDYMVLPGTNGGKPFTRFITFGPSGELLPSVNLDGRGEKFAPGTCVACHGGDRYVGHFPASGGLPDLGSHFLPFDLHNYAFSSTAGLTKADLQPAAYQLNQIVLGTNATPQTVALINGWYAGSATQAEGYRPADWQPGGWVATHLGGTNADVRATNMYDIVIKQSCRTCHAAFVSSINLENPQTGFDIVDLSATTPTVVAGGDSFQWLYPKFHSMPAALVTFDRFWQSANTAQDQPATFWQFYGGLDPQFGGPDRLILQADPTLQQLAATDNNIVVTPFK